MRNPSTQIVYIVLLLFPLSVWGQQTGKWGNGKLRQTVVAISSDVPFATAAYDFTERYLTQLQKMSVAERKSQMERDNVWDYTREYGSSESHQRADIDELFREGKPLHRISYQ